MITIAYGNRMRDIGRSEQEYAVVNVLGMRRIIDFILTCNLEAFIRSYGDNAIISVFQMYETTVSAHFQLLETRTAIEDLVKPIVACSGCHCQSFSNLSFLTGMYLLRLYGINQIVCAYKNSITDAFCHSLLLHAYRCSSCIEGITVTIWCYFYKIER